MKRESLNERTQMVFSFFKMFPDVKFGSTDIRNCYIRLHGDLVTRQCIRDHIHILLNLKYLKRTGINNGTRYFLNDERK